MSAFKQIRSWHYPDDKRGKLLLSGNLHLSEEPHEPGTERIDLKFKLRASASDGIQNRRPFQDACAALSCSLR